MYVRGHLLRSRLCFGTCHQKPVCLLPALPFGKFPWGLGGHEVGYSLLQEKVLKHKKKWWKSKKKSRHHVLPQSKGGTDENNIVILSENVHKAWHILFDNKTPEEAEAYLVALHEVWRRHARRRSWNHSLTSSGSRSPSPTAQSTFSGVSHS